MYSLTNIVWQYTLGVNLTEIFCPAGPQIILFGPARLGINTSIFQNLYNDLNIVLGMGTKTYENFVKYVYNLWFN